MIIFDLACARGHTFEGWFASGDEFARQKSADLVRCPMCDDGAIERRPSARVRVSSPAKGKPRKTQKSRSDAQTKLPAAAIDHIRDVVRKTENVGDRFAEEARKIHYGESDKRGIYGQTTDDEAEALAEEGIEFGRLPWIPRGN